MMARNRKWIALTAAVLVAFLAAGCGQSSETALPKRPYTIGAVTKSKDSEYWMSVRSGMEKAADELGVCVKLVSPDSESNDKMQKKMIHDLLQEEIDAVAISPVSSYDTSYLGEAEEKGIRVFAYDTKILQKGIPYIGSDNKRTGRELAQIMADRLGNRGTVGIVTGDLRQTAHAERMEGICSYLKEHTDIEIAFVESGYGNLLISDAEISRLFSQHPDVEGVFATSGVTALGIRQYLGDSPVLVMTVDAQQDALNAVKKGELAALAAQSGYRIGYETIRFIVQNRKKDQLEPLKDRILDVEILTKENAGAWNEQPGSE